MITALQKIDAVCADFVNKPVFLGDSPGPSPSERVFQWLGLADSLKGIAQHGFDELQNTRGNVSIGFHPETQVLPELGMEYGISISSLCQVLCSAANRQSTTVLQPCDWPCGVQSGAFAHCVESEANAPFLPDSLIPTPAPKQRREPPGGAR
jgi:hypothetical protein